MLDACAECQNLKAAEDFMVETRQAGMVDAVSFNILTKPTFGSGALRKRARIEEMKKGACCRPR